MILIFLFGLVSSLEDVLHKRFEYKHSFKGPSLTDASGKVPFWEAGGSCMPSPDSVRITPSIRSKQGWLWNKIQYVGTNWELEFSLKIHGRGKLGADGMAIWYVQEAPTQGGSVFGAPNNWRGLGIFFDSFDNDNKHDNPAVLAVVNDGSVIYDHSKDGKGQELASCVQGFRNRPHPTQVRMRYYNNVLTLEMNPGITTRETDFETCFIAANVNLPPGGYFGVSAATGALADDHDIVKLITYSLFEKVDQAVPLSEETKAKILSDYEKYDVELEAKKRKYRENHPDRHLLLETEDEQNLFYKSLIDYQVKLSERFDQLSTEVLRLYSDSQKADSGLSVVKSAVANIERQQNMIVNQLESVGTQLSTLQATFNGSNKDLKTIVLALTSVQSQVKELQGRKTTVCPAFHGISFIHLISVVIIQSSLLIGYWIWRNRVEDARKKFF